MVLLYLKNNQDQYFSVDQHAGKFSSTPFLWELERVNELDKLCYLFPHGEQDLNISGCAFSINLVGNDVKDGEPIPCFGRDGRKDIGVLAGGVMGNRLSVTTSYHYNENILYCELPSYYAMVLK